MDADKIKEREESSANTEDEESEDSSEKSDDEEQECYNCDIFQCTVIKNYTVDFIQCSVCQEFFCGGGTCIAYKICVVCANERRRLCNFLLDLKMNCSEKAFLTLRCPSHSSEDEKKIFEFIPYSTQSDENIKGWAAWDGKYYPILNDKIMDRYKGIWYK